MDNLLLALLLNAHTKKVDDSDFAATFKDAEIKKIAKKGLLILLILIAITLPLYLYFQNNLLLSIVFAAASGFAVFTLPFALYAYLRCVIAQWGNTHS